MASSQLGNGSVRYGTLLKALAAARDVEEPGLTAFENRFKHLKRSGFPAGVNLGKTGRYNYSPRDVVGVATALRLMDAYVMPTTAIQLVEGSYRELCLLAVDQIVPQIAAMGGDRAHPRALSSLPDVDPFEPRACAIFRGAALSELGSKPAGVGRYDAPVTTALLLTSRDFGHGLIGLPSSGIVIGGEETYSRLVDELARLGVDRNAFAAGLLERLSPENEPADDKLPGPIAKTWQLRLWHASKLLSYLEKWAPTSEVGDFERLIAHHASLVLNVGEGYRDGDIVLDAASGLTLSEVVGFRLAEVKFPRGGWQAGKGWPSGSCDASVADIRDEIGRLIGKPA